MIYKRKNICRTNLDLEGAERLASRNFSHTSIKQAFRLYKSLETSLSGTYFMLCLDNTCFLTFIPEI